MVVFFPPTRGLEWLVAIDETECELLSLVPEVATVPPLERGLLQLRQMAWALSVLAWAMSEESLADSMVVARARALMVPQLCSRAQLVWLGALPAHCWKRATTRLRVALRP